MLWASHMFTGLIDKLVTHQMNHVYFPWTLWPSKADHLLSDKSNPFSGEKNPVYLFLTAVLSLHMEFPTSDEWYHMSFRHCFMLWEPNLSITWTTLKHLLNMTGTRQLIPSVALWMKSGVSSPMAGRPFCKASNCFFGMSLFLPVWGHSLFQIF